MDTVGSLTLNGTSQVRTSNGNMDVDVAGNVSLNNTSDFITSGGRLELDTQGTLTMNSGSRFTTGSGVMDIFSRNTFRISQVSTSSGTIRLKSENGAIDKISGFSSPNIVSSARPTVEVFTRVNMVIDSDSVLINGFNINDDPDTGLVTVVFNF